MTPHEQFVAAVGSERPAVAVVLGSGQASVLDDLRVQASITFAEVPGLVAPSVAGHSGRIVLGHLDDRPLLVFQGRLHFYEGHSWEMVAAPIRFTAALGIKSLLLTNAAGGIHPDLNPGSMMVVRDHLFWQRPGAWRGRGPAGCHCLAGDRVSNYSPRLRGLLLEAGAALKEPLLEGIYAALTGPCYETPSEIRALQKCGADAVGMSTAHECETATALGMECAAISGVTNRGAGLSEGVLAHRDVLQVMSQIRVRLGRLIAEFVRRME